MSHPNNRDNKKKNDKQGTPPPVDIDDDNGDRDDHKQHKNEMTKKFESESKKEKDISEGEKLKRSKKDDDTTSNIKNNDIKMRRNRKKSKSPTKHLPNEEAKREGGGGGLVSTAAAFPSMNENNNNDTTPNIKKDNTKIRRIRKKSKSPTKHLPYEEAKIEEEDGLVSTTSPVGVPSMNDNNNNNGNDNGFVSKKDGLSREDRRMKTIKPVIDTTTTSSTDDGNTNNTGMTFRMSRMAAAGNTSDSEEDADDVDDSDDTMDDQPGAIPVRGVGRGVGVSAGTILCGDSESHIQEGEDGSKRYYGGGEINNNDDHLVVAELAELPEIVEGTPMVEENKRTRYICRCIAFLLAVVGVVTLILALVLPNTGSRKNDENNTAAAPTAVPTGGTSSPSSAVNTQQNRDFAIGALLPFIPDIPNGPIQEQALDWLVDTENYREEGLIGITTGRLLDRYVLAIFYLSTNGDTWEINDGWLSKNSVCLWFVDADGGTICDDLNGSAGRVQRINLLQNDVAGTVPTELGTLTTLIQLGLGDNKLTGMIPTELGRLTALTELRIDRNDLEGQLPTELGHLTELAHTEMDKNELVGTIPTEFGNLSALTFLDLPTSCCFGAHINVCFVCTGCWNRFASACTIDSNELAGMIPTELGRLTALTHLDLERNMLTGSVPAELNSFLASLDDCNLGCDGGLVGVPANCQKC